MKITIRGEKVSITKSIREYITEKLSKLDKYFDNPKKIECKVVIKVKNTEQSIEVTIPISKLVIRAEESHKDLYSAIDLVQEKLERQIRKNKNRITDKYRNIPNFEINFDVDVDEDYVEEDIVKRKNIEMKPMDEDEAILQLELLNHDFFVFKNIDEECVSVLYKRKDGKYGIINVK